MSPACRCGRAAAEKAAAACDKARKDLAETRDAQKRILKDFTDNEAEAAALLGTLQEAGETAAATAARLAAATAALADAEKGAKGSRDTANELKTAVAEMETALAVRGGWALDAAVHCETRAVCGQTTVRILLYSLRRC
jgi:chromosome segregation ATPase